MKLQKLLYFCHADFLVTVGKPLIRQDFEAWEFGPVIPSIFHEFKRFEAAPISVRAEIFNPITCNREVPVSAKLGPYEPLIRSSFESYSRYTASILSNMSHSESGPWAETLRRFRKGSIKGRSIDNEVIQRHHERPIQRAVH
ncbi:Panacea domain-containing protein [Sphingomonas sp. ID1715]|uniref:Panacea domain-containing protein n=1 Tax=Sphingomonas sp. ID1715 TaxID=1656898 RepID=UPI00349FF24F